MQRNNLHVVGMPPSSYRPSPPSARPPSNPPPAAAIDELMAEHVAETEAEPMAAKKRRKKGGRSPESIAKQKATLAAKKKAAQATGQTLVSPSQRASKPQKNTAEIQLTGVQAWLRAELETLKPELRRLVREELRAMLAGG